MANASYRSTTRGKTFVPYVISLLVLPMLFAVTGTTVAAGPITVEFQQGLDSYSGTVDTWLREQFPETDYGAEPWLRWDTSSSGYAIQSVLRFGALFTDNGGPIPSGNPSLIVSATLHLQGSNEPGDPALLHRMLQPWSDTDTWSIWGNGPPHNNLGGIQDDDVEAASTADATVPPVPGGFSVDVITSLVEWAQDPSQNFGWVFLPTAGDGFGVNSSEAVVQAVRPRLEVTFVPEPTTLSSLLFLGGIVTLKRKRRRTMHPTIVD